MEGRLDVLEAKEDLGQGRRPPTRAVGVVHGNCATMSSVGVVHGAGGTGGAILSQPFQLCARPRPSARHRPGAQPRPGAHRWRGIVNAVSSVPHHPLLAPHCWRRIVGTTPLALHRWRRIIGAASSALYCRRCIIGAASLAPHHRQRIIGDALLAILSAPH